MHSHHHHHHHQHGHGHDHGDLAAANKAHFNENAHNYDTTPYILEATKKIGEGILAEIPFDKESTTVMDFACGTGLVANVLGCRRRRSGICKELKGELGELNDAKFDVVVCSMAYHHFDPVTLLDTTKILASFIRPGGYLVIVDNEPTAADASDGDMPKHTIGKPGGFTSAEMERLFTDAGLSSFTYNHLTQFERRDGVHQRVFLAKAQKPSL
ncbi:s-adenosylmethionine-dependent methyltransferase [Moniliophthora roreri MCA 2997]|uniref:S-adenosylmethionine-dependent methyltransferase n=1 Tax=Moniliophthora roreri (strain MCA 2997) TaxID=1381753 RepID=V2XB75_MONRO|nr:s-adenosylmethionine-dependent methyltransferase [Moniliophthora roreri MCA 2997]